jgi:ABC-2 type transport system permease protein
MSEIEGIYTIWRRENTRFLRYKSRIVTSVVTPLLWLVVFGTGFGSAVRFGGIPGGYQAFLFPGIIGMTVLFSSLFSGISVIQDRQYGFLKEMFVAPISRSSIVFGKALGASTTAMIQGTIILLLAFILNIHLTVLGFIAAMIIMVIMSLGLVGIGLFISAFMESMEGFNLIMNFVVMPMFFLSGALFPITSLPEWLEVAVYLDPVTYGVDALRYATLGTSAIPMHIDIVVIMIFAAVMIFASAYAFTKREQGLM